MRHTLGQDLGDYKGNYGGRTAGLVSMTTKGYSPNSCGLSEMTFLYRCLDCTKPVNVSACSDWVHVYIYIFLLQAIGRISNIP